MADSTRQSVLFPALIAKPAVAAFDQEHSSRDGGALLLKAIDQRLGLSERLRDGRQAGKVRHDLGELVAQRLFAIALGYPDGNDVDALGDDPIRG